MKPVLLTPDYGRHHGEALAAGWLAEQEESHPITAVDVMRLIRPRVNVVSILAAGRFDESKHKRANDGKFSSSGGGGGKAGTKGASSSKPTKNNKGAKPKLPKGYVEPEVAIAQSLNTKQQAKLWKKAPESVHDKRRELVGYVESENRKFTKALNGLRKDVKSGRITKEAGLQQAAMAWGSAAEQGAAASARKTKALKQGDYDAALDAEAEETEAFIRLTDIEYFVVEEKLAP